MGGLSKIIWFYFSARVKRTSAETWQTTSRFGRKKGVIIPMILTAIGAAVSVLLTTDDESNKGKF